MEREKDGERERKRASLTILVDINGPGKLFTNVLKNVQFSFYSILFFFLHTFAFLSITVPLQYYDTPSPNQDYMTIDKTALKYFTAYKSLLMILS